MFDHTNGKTKIMRLLFKIIGVLLLIIDIFISVNTWQFINRAVKAEGVVIYLNHGGSHPEIRYTTLSGQLIDYPQGGFIFGYHIGDKLKVLYDPQNPTKACVDNFGALWGLSIFICLMGIIFILIPLNKKK